MDLERSLTETWPTDTEFVILRKSDWQTVRALVNDVIGVEGTVLDGMVLLPCELDAPAVYTHCKRCGDELTQDTDCDICGDCFDGLDSCPCGDSGGQTIDADDTDEDAPCWPDGVCSEWSCDYQGMTFAAAWGSYNAKGARS